MGAQYGLKASLFQKIREVLDGNILVLIVGDFNYPHINWGDGRCTLSTSGNFINFCEDIYLKQNVVEGIKEETL